MAPTPIIRSEVVTLAVAMVAQGGIIVGSDSKVTHAHEFYGVSIGSYTSYENKLFPCARNTAVFCTSGDSGAIGNLLSAAKAASFDIQGASSFNEAVQIASLSFAQQVERIYRGKWPCPDCGFLFCGYEQTGAGHVPRLVRLLSGSNFRPEYANGGFSSIGQQFHGVVVYLSKAVYDSSLSTEQGMALAYTMIAETSFHDDTVGGEMVIATIRPGSPIEVLKTEPELSKYRKTWQDFHERIKSLFLESNRF